MAKFNSKEDQIINTAFLEEEAELERQLDEMHKQWRDAQDNLINHRLEFCATLRTRFRDYIGKHVRITFSQREWNRDRAEVTGYLLDFYMRDGRIFPYIAKEKKDGTESKNKYMYYDTGSWNHIENIELI